MKRRAVASVGTSGGLERGATEKPTGRKLNKTTLLVFSGYRKPRMRDLTEVGVELAEAFGLRAWLRP
jgi:hypothetical protein